VSLANGTRLGPYELVSLVGAGGMGEVYRARDTRLDRVVAIKVLLGGIAHGNLQARFEREARAVSALSDPHICTLYDIGHEGDALYLVMEFLEGETLADRIARGALPMSQGLRFGVQIAEALQHAHRAGITHRDLKPGNIMITSSGVKLLDFGLAKFAEPPLVTGDSQQTTLANPLTAEGTIVGTIHYMSPEQLEGKSVDHRTDIFALGVILYEMATGRRPFGGSSSASVIAAILSHDPVPPRSVQPGVPAALDRLILTALEKSPDERWQTSQDVAHQLRWLAESTTAADAHGAATSAAAPPPSGASSDWRPFRLLLPAMLLFTALLASLLTWAAVRRYGPRPARAIAARLQLALPEDLRLVSSFDAGAFAVSPDGATIAFVASRGGTRSLFLRRLDSAEVQSVEGSDNASAPFWSSDGVWIGFGSRGKLWKTRIAGNGAPQALCDAPPQTVASWRGRTILFGDAPGGRREIYRISDAGGEPVKVTSLRPGEWRHSWPFLLPDGRHFLFQVFAADSIDRQLFFASIESPLRAAVVKSVSQAVLAAPDRLAFVRDGQLLGQRFDVERGTTIGEPVIMARDVSYFYPSGRAEFDASPRGVVVYHRNTSTGRLVSLDRKGLNIRVIDDKGPFFDWFSLSDDGRKAAVTVVNRGNGLGEIWLYDLTRAVRDRFTSHPGLEVNPIWAPGGRFIVYSDVGGGTYPHLVRRSLASSTSEDLTQRGAFEFAGSFSRDGSTLFYTKEDPRRRGDIFRLDMKTRASTAVLSTPFDEADPQASPDGKWLAYVSDATGAGEVYLQSMTDENATRIRISTSGGHNPRWRRDSGELFYWSSEGNIVSVAPRRGGEWGETTAQVLFHAPAGSMGWAVTPDGQSFVVVEGAPGTADALLNVIINPMP
jgi:Tol biopolymer transport system component